MFQILITPGATIVIEELIRIVWGPSDQVMPVPLTLQGSWAVLDVIVLRVPVHAMFFGLGAYTVALFLLRLGAPTCGWLALGVSAAVAVAGALAALIGAFSLRVKAIFFAMITLACAEFALILAVQLSGLTGGEDGLSPRLPGVLAVGWTGRVLGVPPTGRLVTYDAVVAVVIVLFLVMRRFVDSPLGRTLQAIRDNALRAEALAFGCSSSWSSSSSPGGSWARCVGPGQVGDAGSRLVSPRHCGDLLDSPRGVR